jgi:hypothetical protein
MLLRECGGVSGVGGKLQDDEMGGLGLTVVWKAVVGWEGAGFWQIVV